MSNTITRDQIATLDDEHASMSGEECWNRWVGRDSPTDYTAAELAAYLDDCPFGWVSPSARRALEAYREERVEVAW